MSLMTVIQRYFIFFFLYGCRFTTSALTVVLAGGTGPVGQGVAARLATNHHDVTVLTRNAFLAATPSRVTEQFGWMGQAFLQAHFPHVTLRDWDGGDLLDIVGKDWVGWQDDTLPSAQVIVHLVGGFTNQRAMACERIVRECLRLNREALHVTVSPTDEDMGALGVGSLSLKRKRIEDCENMVRQNCPNHICLRLEAYRVEKGCDEIVAVIEDWSKRLAASETS